MRNSLICIIFSSILLVGCVKPYSPNKPKALEQNKVVIAATAFDNYRLEKIKIYRELAERTAKGEFEYVAQLLDAHTKLDIEARKISGAPINTRIAAAIGSDKLDKDAGAKILRQLADELEGK